jgi:serine/threonine-protein kinase
MTPERWRQIDDIFDAATRLEPSERADWLHRICGNDEGLEIEVTRLLEQDALASHDQFLIPPELDGQSEDGTASWPGMRSRPHSDGTYSRDRPTSPLKGDTDTQGFTPKAAIAGAESPDLGDELRVAVRARLRETPIVYACIFGMMLSLRPYMLAYSVSSIWISNTVVIAILIGIAAVLSSNLPFSLVQLRAVELAMMSMLAGMIAFYEYRMLLLLSLEKDPIGAHMTMKNVVLLSSLLILTFGIYVPKSWRQAAAVAIPLAILPLTTMYVANFGHPDAFSWLFVPRNNRSVPLISYGLDAIFLLILAAVSSFGAHVLTRLRSQVAEARLLGQYRLGERIGTGGMGEVYLAEHRLLKRPCALKLIRTNGTMNPRILDRFEREVRLTATLSHPNTVEIYDYGRTENGTYYYVMEYLPGLSLSDLVERHGPLPPGRVVYLLRQVCQALSEAHQAGLIHRDVKPSNIFAAQRGGMHDVAKLLDFGLVRPVTTAPQSHVSAEGQILGTPLYMSPEQAVGSLELDGRSDIYSLGAVAYFMLTGRPPFNEKSWIGAMIAHARDPVVPPSKLRPDVPEDLERIVLRCLAKPLNERYQKADCLERDLLLCACAADWDRAAARIWWRNLGVAPKTSLIET